MHAMILDLHHTNLKVACPKKRYRSKLTNAEGTPAPAKEATPANAKAEAYTLEQVRSTLAELSRKGYTDAVRELLRKHGAKKLSEVEPARYGALMADAKEIGHV